MASLITKPLGRRHHHKDDFFCGEPTLDLYFKQYAAQDQKRRVAAVFILADAKKQIKGYYSLSSTNIASDDLPEKILKRLPKHPYQPATLLGRLAVDQRYQRQRVGETLLLDALYRSTASSQEFGSIAVVVEALNSEAIDYYKHYGFIPFSNQTKLFLPMQTISRLF